MNTTGYEGRKSDHFDGTEFKNDPPLENRSLGDALKWIWTRERGPWEDVKGAAFGPPPPQSIGKGHLRVTYVNHSTLLVQVDGLNILTDPVWSDRASPFSWIGPERYRPPGIRFEDLPKIDVVIISHNHYDHMDLKTVKRLLERDNPKFIVALGNAHLLQKVGVTNVVELDWWDTLPVNDLVSIAAVPARHHSGRGPFDRGTMLWCGFVIKGSGGPIYFAGDTGMGPHFEEIEKRFGPMRLAMLPIGAYLPLWFMSSMHMSPEDAVKVHTLLKAQTSIAIHFGTFRLADDAQNEAQEVAAKLAHERGLEDHFWILDFGEGRDVPSLEPVQANAHD